MPADREYLEKFYDKSPDSPRGKITKEEFLSKVDYFYSEQPFAKAFVVQTLPHDLIPSPDDIKRFNEEKARPENIVNGWDNFMEELIKDIPEELAQRKDPVPYNPQQVIELIKDAMAGLGKLISGEMGRPEQDRRITLEEISSTLWESRKKFLGGVNLIGSIDTIRDKLAKSGVQEYLADSMVPPNWANGRIIIEHPSDGFDYGSLPEKEVVPFVIFQEQGASTYYGNKCNNHFGEPTFYDVDKAIKVGGYTFNTIYRFDPLGHCNKFVTDPVFWYTRKLKSGASHDFLKPTHSILHNYYLRRAKDVLQDQRAKTTFTLLYNHFQPSKQVKRTRAMVRTGQTDRVQRNLPLETIFDFEGTFKDVPNTFAHIMAWMVECGIIEFGEIVTNLNPTIVPVMPATNIHIGVKNMQDHIRARLLFVDPMFHSGPKDTRQFLLVGFKIISAGHVLVRGSKIKVIRRRIFIVLECPTTGIIELSLFGPGLPLHDEALYEMWQEGKLDGIYIAGQTFTLCQFGKGNVAIPARRPSDLAMKLLLFNKGTALPPTKSEAIF